MRIKRTSSRTCAAQIARSRSAGGHGPKSQDDLADEDGSCALMHDGVPMGMKLRKPK